MFLQFILVVFCFSEVNGLLYPPIYFSHVYNYTPPEDDITFFLYERFNSELPTKIIVHGWTHGKDVPWIIEMREGHSMGAQICAMASDRIRSYTGNEVGRITGLDPAAPLYEWPHFESSDEILDSSDAIFVDVVHTNGKGLGMITPAGHVDYYPSGGEVQEGCMSWSCSHLRACEFWTASIRKPDLFKAYSYKSLDGFMDGKLEYLYAYPMGIAAGPQIPKGLYFVKPDDEYKKYLNTKTTIKDSMNKMD
ncbi:hypothetical protein NQ318_003632 [Aromia moschata]|uniref:Lipase domain-containing protein n=1 Tax=Aromia moschata TaxID=1265417 RepID=A0AAV8XU13_9CUCU|nr:hypothetical protein NQ318_003632 [Aromia moschata]